MLLFGVTDLLGSPVFCHIQKILKLFIKVAAILSLFFAIGGVVCDPLMSHDLNKIGGYSFSCDPPVGIDC